MKLLYFYYKKEHKNVLALPEAQDYAASNVKSISPKTNDMKKVAAFEKRLFPTHCVRCPFFTKNAPPFQSTGTGV